MLFESSGYIKYSKDPYKVILTVDQGIADFYRSLVPKTRYIQRQMHGAHASIVRNQTPIRMKYWGKHENTLTNFYYDNIIHWCDTYYWINIYCRLGERIREELCLPIYKSNDAPDGFTQKFHVTIGNCKQQ